MNRRVLAVAVVLAALGGFTGYAQRPAAATNGARAAWEAERAFQRGQVMERARRQFNNTLLKVEIGTVAPVDVEPSRQALAQMEALVKADAARTLPGTLPMPDVAALRLKVAQALNNLDAAEVRFDVGLLTTAEMNNAYFAVLKLLVN